MPRRTRDERRQEVINAATEQVLQAHLDWAASVKLGELAIETGIDQNQISRDFGSKEGLIEAVLDELFSTDENGGFIENSAYWLQLIVENPEIEIGEILEGTGSYFESLIVGETGRRQLRQYSLMGVVAEDSHERTKLGEMTTELLEETAVHVDETLKRWTALGATPRAEFDNLEFVTLGNALICGLVMHRAVAPGLVPDGLFARALATLLLGVLGPDAERPSDTVKRIPRTPS